MSGIWTRPGGVTNVDPNTTGARIAEGHADRLRTERGRAWVLSLSRQLGVMAAAFGVPLAEVGLEAESGYHGVPAEAESGRCAWCGDRAERAADLAEGHDDPS